MSNNALSTSTNIVNQTIQVVSVDEIRQQEQSRILALIPKIVSEIENHEIWGSTGECSKCGTLGNYRIAHRVEIVTALIEGDN
jgi:hypothetical protein